MRSIKVSSCRQFKSESGHCVEDNALRKKKLSTLAFYPCQSARWLLERWDWSIRKGGLSKEWLRIGDGGWWKEAVLLNIELLLSEVL